MLFLKVSVHFSTLIAQWLLASSTYIITTANNVDVTPTKMYLIAKLANASVVTQGVQMSLTTRPWVEPPLHDYLLLGNLSNPQHMDS